MGRRAFFLEGADGGGRFCLVTAPESAIKGGLLYLHPFAEEMNKSRRMAALAASAFAQRGWMVLQLDLAGCGDSAGDFGDATWEAWVDDVRLGWSWLGGHCDGVRGLWTLRGGSLLAGDWLAQGREQPPLLLWHPVSNGRQHLTQFLRLVAAGEIVADADGKTALAEARAQLQSGRAIEVAGYTLAAALARGIEGASLRLPDGFASPVAAFEVASPDRTAVSPALQGLVDTWIRAGIGTTAEAVTGPAFWQTQEIETAPALVERSCRWLDGLAA